MIVKSSESTPQDAEATLLAGIEKRGLKLFARLDHAAAAREAGAELHPETVLVFGSPLAGTPLMESDPRVGIELPLRILLWGEEGGTHLAYEDPRELADRFEVGEHAETLARMAVLLEQLVGEAAG